MDVAYRGIVVSLLVVCGLSTWLIVALESTTFYVTPKPGQNCPKPDYPCHTLDEYALNRERYFSNLSNISLVFLRGNHRLSYDFELSNRTSFSMFGLDGHTVTINVMYGGRVSFSDVVNLYLNSMNVVGNGGVNVTNYIATNARSDYLRVEISNTVFINNSGHHIVCLDYGTTQGGSALFKNVSFRDNSGLSTVLVNGPGNTTIVDSTFVDNVVPITVIHGTLFVSGNNRLSQNQGSYGGGIALINSRLVLASNTAIVFDNNYANIAGGALYVSNEQNSTSKACFYEVDVDSAENIEVVFVDNYAGLGGTDIYGAALRDDCLVSGGHKSVDVYKKYFILDPDSIDVGHSNLSRISSDPKRVCLCENGQPPAACDSIDHILVPQREVYFGEMFTVSAVLVGDEFGTLSGPVYANVGLLSPLKLGPLQDVQTVNFETCITLTFSLQLRYPFFWTGAQTFFLSLSAVKHVSPSIQPPSRQSLQQLVDEYHNTSVIPSSLLNTPVYLNLSIPWRCPLGFGLQDQTSSLSCGCSNFLINNSISNCSIINHKGYVYRTGTQWVGLYNYSSVAVSQHCPLGYCNQCKIPTTLEHHDQQCMDYRSGLLCGKCKDNHSLMLGSSECRLCENNSHLALLLVFALAGVLLVLFVKLLDLTVAVGTINGLLFYTNIVWANQNIILPTLPMTPVFGDILHVFLAWTNLDFGIRTCFFVGMNALSKTSLQIIFPLYIWALAGLIILLSKYSKRASQFFGNNSVPLLATLFLLSYSKILRFIIKALSFNYIYYQVEPWIEKVAVVWSEDGNIPYLSPAHCVLFAVGLLCLLCLWAPFMLTLSVVHPASQEIQSLLAFSMGQ